MSKESVLNTVKIFLTEPTESKLKELRQATDPKHDLHPSTSNGQITIKSIEEIKTILADIQLLKAQNALSEKLSKSDHDYCITQLVDSDPNNGKLRSVPCENWDFAKDFRKTLSAQLDIAVSMDNNIVDIGSQLPTFTGNLSSAKIDPL